MIKANEGITTFGDEKKLEMMKEDKDVGNCIRGRLRCSNPIMVKCCKGCYEAFNK